MENPSDLFLLPDDDYDRRVLSEGNDVCRALNLPEHVRRIVWLDRVPGLTLHSDECYFHGNQGYFPARMKARLEPKDWRALIASYRMFLHIRRNMPGRVLLIMPAVFLTLISGVFVARILGTDIGETMGVLLLVTNVPLFVGLVAQGKKMLRLQADLFVARVEGKEEFLRVLRKILDFDLSDVLKTENSWVSRLFSSRPRLSDRIRNLELFNEQSLRS